MARSSANSLLQRELLDTIKGLRSTIENLQITIEDLRKALSESQERERVAKEQIEVMTKRLFGRSSEKHMAQSEGQMDFFNEIEVEADRAPAEEEPFADDPEDVQETEEKKRKGVLCVQRCSRDSGLWKSPLSNCRRTSRFVITAAQG